MDKHGWELGKSEKIDPGRGQSKTSVFDTRPKIKPLAYSLPEFFIPERTNHQRIMKIHGSKTAAGTEFHII